MPFFFPDLTIVNYFLTLKYPLLYQNTVCLSATLAERREVFNMLSTLEQALLFLSFLGLMIGIGASLTPEQLREALRNRRALIGGLALQYLLLPSLACLWVMLLALPAEAAWIVLLIATCPGGSTSNMFTYLSKGEVSLSLLLTFTSTLLSVFMTPLLLQSFGLFFDQQYTITIPVGNLASTLAIALLPVFIGFGLRLKSKSLALRAEKIGSVVGYLSIGLMLIIWYPKTQALFQTQDLRIVSAVGLLSFTGILGSLLISLAAGTRGAIARTLSFETGIQNAPLAFAIVSLHLPLALAQSVGWIPLAYGALSVGSAALFTAFYQLWAHAIDRRQKRVKITP